MWGYYSPFLISLLRRLKVGLLDFFLSDMSVVTIVSYIFYIFYIGSVWINLFELSSIIPDLLIVKISLVTLF
jgi:hypothetical protein